MGRDSRLKQNPDRKRHPRRADDAQLQLVRAAIHEAGHAVVGLRLGLDIDSAIIGAGLIQENGEPMGGEVKFTEMTWNVDTPEGWRRRAVVKLAGAAAEIDLDEGFNTQERWDSAWEPDRND